MKYKLALVMSAFCAFSVWTEAKVKLPAILSDGMVLQRERSVKIWYWRHRLSEYPHRVKS